MNIITHLKYSAVLITVVLLNSLGHASIMPATNPGGMHHNSEDAISCATLCRTAPVNKDTINTNRPDEEDKDEPTPPFYLLSQSVAVSNETLKQKLYADKTLPPPKVPMHILYGVFRV